MQPNYKYNEDFKKYGFNKDHAEPKEYCDWAEALSRDEVLEYLKVHDSDERLRLMNYLTTEQRYFNTMSESGRVKMRERKKDLQSLRLVEARTGRNDELRFKLHEKHFG